MTERDFVYWLQGMLELSGAETLDVRQVAIIRDHLKLVFTKATPDRTQQTVTGPFIPIDFSQYVPKYTPAPAEHITVTCGGTLDDILGSRVIC